jgi:hypothetical protein
MRLSGAVERVWAVVAIITDAGSSQPPNSPIPQGWV